jgi:hypothetical protein
MVNRSSRVDFQNPLIQKKKYSIAAWKEQTDNHFAGHLYQPNKIPHQPNKINQTQEHECEHPDAAMFKNEEERDNVLTGVHKNTDFKGIFGSFFRV